MEITLHTEQWYDAAHHLEKYDGACQNLHGHTYRVELWVKGQETQLDKTGILFDFGNLKQLAKQLDHSIQGDLNNIIGKNSTAEHQAIWFYKNLVEMNPDLKYKVRVYEQVQPKESWAEVGDFKK